MSNQGSHCWTNSLMTLCINTDFVQHSAFEVHVEV